MKHLLFTLTSASLLLLLGCADAGKNQTVKENTEVFFDVSGVKADLGGKITQYNWELIGDEADDYDITILNNGKDNASFISPSVSKDIKLTFKLTSIESYKCKTSDDSSCKHHKSTDKVKIKVTDEDKDRDSNSTSS